MKKKILYPILNVLLKLYSTVRSPFYNADKTILIFSSPRGGSTWLSEIIGSLPGYFVMWEPLHPGNNPDCRKFEFSWNNFQEKNSVNTTKFKYLLKLFKGELLNSGTTSLLSFSLKSLLLPKVFVVKFVNGNLLAPWIGKNFKNPIIYMYRHPCAVVSSQLRHGSWEKVNKENVYIHPDLKLHYPELVEIKSELKTKEEVLAFDWGINNLYLMQNADHKRMLILSYEEMVTDTENQLNKIKSYLGLPSNLNFPFHKKSSTATSDFNSDPILQLSAWKKRLSEEQIQSILNVVHRMGITIYKEDVMPLKNDF